MKLKILWLYNDLMDLYGDRGNLKILEYRCNKRNIECQIDTCSIGENKDVSKYDICFMGGGADNEQAMLYKDCLNRKKNFEEAIKQGTFFLLICGGFQLFGKYYKESNGDIIDGANIFDYYTEASDDKVRCVGNICIEVELDGIKYKIVGFENHGGQTLNVTSPFGKVIKGHGNVMNGENEGFFKDNLIGTYLHGPILSKNPELADYIIKKALERNNKSINLEKLDDTFELKAKEIIFDRL